MGVIWGTKMISDKTGILVDDVWIDPVDDTIRVIKYIGDSYLVYDHCDKLTERKIEGTLTIDKFKHKRLVLLERNGKPYRHFDDRAEYPAFRDGKKYIIQYNAELDCFFGRGLDIEGCALDSFDWIGLKLNIRWPS